MNFSAALFDERRRKPIVDTLGELYAEDQAEVLSELTSEKRAIALRIAYAW